MLEATRKTTPPVHHRPTHNPHLLVARNPYSFVSLTNIRPMPHALGSRTSFRNSMSVDRSVRNCASCYCLARLGPIHLVGNAQCLHLEMCCSASLAASHQWLSIGLCCEVPFPTKRNTYCSRSRGENGDEVTGSRMKVCHYRKVQFTCH